MTDLERKASILPIIYYINGCLTQLEEINDKPFPNVYFLMRAQEMFNKFKELFPNHNITIDKFTQDKEKTELEYTIDYYNAHVYFCMPTEEEEKNKEDNHDWSWV